MADEPTSPQAWLEFSDGRMHWLDKNACTIGRTASNTLPLDNPGLSRSHAMIQPTPGGWFLTDLRSTNGTYHNGLRLEQGVALRDGDKIELSGITLTFRCQQAGEPSNDAGATSVQIHSGDCWLLMLDLIGHTAHTHAVGAEMASADFKRWLELVRPGLVSSGGTINAYLGDAVFGRCALSGDIAGSESGEHHRMPAEHRIAPELRRTAVEQIGRRGPLPPRRTWRPDLRWPPGREIV